MPISRYDLRRRAININPMYKEYFRERGVKFIEQYRTGKITYPTTEQLRDMSVIEHIWTVGDRYEKLAFRYYGDVKLWWIIAWINRRPGEFLNSVGDVIFIPSSAEDSMALMNV